jgi:lipoyl-dependent peroxiredoxin
MRPAATFTRHATAAWTGEVTRGAGVVTAGTGAFDLSVTFPRLSGEPPSTTTPEELLAASHATCYAIGLRSVIGARKGTATQVSVTATITAEKGAGAIRILSSHLHGVVEGLEGIDPAELPGIARTAEEGCTISNAIRGIVAITSEVTAI